MPRGTEGREGVQPDDHQLLQSAHRVGSCGTVVQGNAIMKLKNKYTQSTTTVASGRFLPRIASHRNRIDSPRFVRFGLVCFGFANINHLSVEINN